MAEKSQMDKHLQNSTFGAPKVNPDEQRRYLGTFRERVSLAMTIAEVKDRHNVDAFITEITAHPDYQIILNGHIGQGDLAPYLKVAGQRNLKFTIRNDIFYGMAEDDYGLIVASDHAINKNPVDLLKKYPKQSASSDTPDSKKSLLDKLLGK
ncbi:YueI family protein [Levilactobacillus tujiorum]|uniref:YueI family protein n=1 Tax=Levilactobacillus tujiorum TaxID=2912243 RepID=A0ABX1L4X6_9LACO|nr:YueI family protein [Levilactobacillus tujiorum]MCH5464724.1 YueI family protein [Levilactobacillus tujiorum]NLR11796.1 YueI family protein [Lactobacillus sp. HBUAS51387]NLR29703.1 YueI family protein [Levilactobacillus tujiorum]NLR31097.1 YueI family protein [Levilactobacillus tujiorum]